MVVERLADDGRYRLYWMFLSEQIERTREFDNYDEMYSFKDSNCLHAYYVRWERI